MNASISTSAILTTCLGSTSAGRFLPQHFISFSRQHAGMPPDNCDNRRVNLPSIVALQQA
jgi:hypothetical protein